MSPQRDDPDEPGGFDRPRRRTRPRTKDRPTYADAVPGLVVTVDRGRSTVRVDGAAGEREVAAMMARPLGHRAVVVGDRVRLVGDVSGGPGTMARLVEVAPRRSVLRRTADDDDPVERIIVANADQMVIVTSVADPQPRPRLVDRCLVAAYDAGLDPLLCINKADLGSPEPLIDTYKLLGVPHVVTRRGGDLAPLGALLQSRVSVLVGHSGVGKSTLVNALVPGADRTTGGVNAVTGRGRHTSTSVYALELPGGGWAVDTPGIRSFGLAHVSRDRVLHAFGDLAAAAANCPRGCTHTAAEPECALDDAAATGSVDARRVESFRRLLAARDRRTGD